MREWAKAFPEGGIVSFRQSRNCWEFVGSDLGWAGALLVCTALIYTVAETDGLVPSVDRMDVRRSARDAGA